MLGVKTKWNLDDYQKTLYNRGFKKVRQGQYLPILGGRGAVAKLHWIQLSNSESINIGDL
jgi:hypothetical protein